MVTSTTTPTRPCPARPHEVDAKVLRGEVDVYNDDSKLTFDAEVQVAASAQRTRLGRAAGRNVHGVRAQSEKLLAVQYTMVHSLANRAIGYVPNLRSYPVRGRTWPRCAPAQASVWSRPPLIC